MLKRIEVWAAVSINRGDLSIKDDIADGKASYLPNRIGEAKAKVIATLGKETDGARGGPVSPGCNAGLEKANAEQGAAPKLSSLDSTKLRLACRRSLCCAGHDAI